MSSEFEVLEVTEDYSGSSAACTVTLELAPENQQSNEVSFSFGVDEEEAIRFRTLKGDPGGWTEAEIDRLPDAKEFAKREVRRRLTEGDD